MPTRRTRTYKERRTVSICAQLALPLSALMAVALFYFSIRLFFSAPSPEQIDIKLPFDAGNKLTAASEAPERAYAHELFMEDEAVFVPATKNSAVKEEPRERAAAKVPSAQIKKTNSSTGIKIKEATEPKTIKKPVPVKLTETKSSEKKEPQTTETKAGAKPLPSKAEALSRWDIQVGGFSNKEGAELTAAEAKKLGCRVYFTESSRDGKPFYKVRVKGFTDKNETEQLSAKLTKAGLPVYLIEIKKTDHN